MINLLVEKSTREFMSLGKTKFAVKVPAFGNETTDWIYITKDDVDGVKVVVYENRELAETHAKMCRGRVVEYEH